MAIRAGRPKPRKNYHGNAPQELNKPYQPRAVVPINEPPQGVAVGATLLNHFVVNAILIVVHVRLAVL